VGGGGGEEGGGVGVVVRVGVVHLRDLDRGISRSIAADGKH